jgi:hypothetical protein
MACSEEIGTDGDGNPVRKLTRFGAVVEAAGVHPYAYDVGGNMPKDNLEKLKHRYPRVQENRAEVVEFLRLWADSIEAGE